VLEQRGLGVLEAFDVRHRFSRAPAAAADVEALVAELSDRFARREASDIRRIQQVLALARSSGCLTNALVAHFGERREAPCGHCSGCAHRGPLAPTESGDVAPPGERVKSASVPAEPALSDRDQEALCELVRQHAGAIEEPRQLARFLCGLTSPATSRARLTRHPYFGIFAERSFVQVLCLAERVLGAGLSGVA
jgi:ATP-dependent DNA helicase RecQ